MGTFGLGGLHRKSTWLYPVSTFAALPPVALDGSVAVTLDTNSGYEYDAALPGWILVFDGGGVAAFFNRIVTAINTGVISSVLPGFVPLVVIDNNGNVVTQ